MRRAITALVVLALLLAGFVGWYVFGSRVPDKPKLDSTSNTGGGPATPNGSWHIVRGKNVYVGYRIKEKFGDALLERDAVGQTLAVNGTMAIAANRVNTATVSANLTKLGSDRSARDSYVRDTTLETDKFPTARFTLTKPIVLPRGVTKGQSLKGLQAKGTMLLHGVTKPITFTLDARWNGPTIDVVGSAPITLADYGIDPPDTVIARVDDHGEIELDLVFAPNG